MNKRVGHAPPSYMLDLEHQRVGIGGDKLLQLENSIVKMSK